MVKSPITLPAGNKPPKPKCTEYVITVDEPEHIHQLRVRACSLRDAVDAAVQEVAADIGKSDGITVIATQARASTRAGRRAW